MYDGNRERRKLEQMTEVSTKSSFEAMLKAVDTMQSSVCVRRVLSRYFDINEVSCTYMDCQLCCNCAARSIPETAVGTSSIDVFLEPDHGNCTKDNVDVSFGTQLLSYQRDLGQQLLFYTQMYTTKCIVCWVAKGSIREHAGVPCPYTNGLCFRYVFWKRPLCRKMYKISQQKKL